MVVGKDKNGLLGAQVIKLGATIAWTDETGKQHEEQLSGEHQIVVISEGVLKFSTLTDGLVNEIELIGTDAVLQTDINKRLQNLVKHMI